jgi:iron complex transport system substrate-binding protein
VDPYSRRRRTIAGALAAMIVAALAVAAPTGSLAQSPSTAAGPVTVVDASGSEVTIHDASRVATLGGVVTETAYALGAAGQVVGVDASSSHPAEALAEKAVLPYYRTLTAEPVLAAGPTLVIGTAEVGPPEVVTQLTDAGVTVLLLPVDDTVDGAVERIGAIGHALGRDAEATELAAQVQVELDEAADLVATATSAPRVMFVLLPPGAPLLVSGTGSAADLMLSLAGATNALTTFPGYIPLTPETAAQAAPDIILTTDSSLAAAGGVDGLTAHPGIAETPAGQSGTIVAMDDLYLLGFGPRTGQAVADLARLLHPELAP